jgi:hypothetical protein
MTGMVRVLTDRDALVGAWCPMCNGPFRVGQRAVIEPNRPAHHEDCDALARS